MSGIDPSQPILPDFGGRCITEIIPVLVERNAASTSAFIPGEVLGARQVVLLVIDGFGYVELEKRRSDLANLGTLTGGSITSVLPTTTATALSSITTGTPPATHGVVGYRLMAGSSVLNVLKWTTPKGSALEEVPPRMLQKVDPFAGTKPPVVSTAEFAGSGFTDAHLSGARLVGWRMPSSIAIEVSDLLAEGEQFVYVYYDGVDKIAHEKGLREHFAAELQAIDRIVGEIIDRLPAGAALCITADHGQIEVLEPPIALDEEIAENVIALSGEGRFRWLHVEPTKIDIVRQKCEDIYGKQAWVRTKDELVEQNWFGGPFSPEISDRLGDVALVPRDPVAFFDPSDTGELRLIARHGSATPDEMLVPFLSIVK